MHLHTLLPTLGQSSCSRGHRLVDSLSGRATCACPPSKKLIGWAPEPVANTQRLHEFHHIGPCKQSNSSNGPDQTQTVQIICQTGINQLSSATYHSLWYIPSSANKHQSTMRSFGVLTSGSISLRHSHSFFILWRYLCSLSQICRPHAVWLRLGSLHVAPSHSGSLCVSASSAWHVFPHWINNAGSQNSR